MKRSAAAPIPRRRWTAIAAIPLLLALPAGAGIPPAADSAYLARARALAAAGKPALAVALLSAQIRRAPEDASLHRELAGLYLAAGDRERSAIAAAEASALDPDLAASWGDLAVQARSVGDTAQALVAARERLRLRAEDCDTWLLAAILESERGDEPRATQLLVDAARVCPDHPRVLAACARALAAAGCEARALGYFERAFRLDPSAPGLGRRLDETRQAVRERFAAVDRELAVLESGVATAIGRERPDHPLALRLDALASELERLAGSDPLDPEVAIRLAVSRRLEREARRDADNGQALAAVDRALALRPGWEQALVLLGTLLVTGENASPRAAEHAFVEALANAGERPLPSAWSGLFFARVAANRYREAADAADRYLTLVPDDTDLAQLRDHARSLTPGGR